MNGSSNNATTTIGPARIFYHHLLSPYSQGANQDEKKYSVTMLVPKSDPDIKRSIDAAIEAAMDKGIQTKWNGVAPPRPAIPLYDGDDLRSNGEPFGPEASGNYVLTASSKEQPEIVDTALQPIDDPKEVYSGMYICATLRFAPYIYEGMPGIRCVIGPIMKVMDGALIPQQPPMEQALSHAAKKLHRQMISGMAASLSPDRLGDDMPYNDRGDSEAPPPMQLHTLFDSENTPEPGRGIAQPKAPSGQSEDESLQKKASAAAVPAPMDDLENRLEKLKNQSVTLEEFKILMQEPA